MKRYPLRSGGAETVAELTLGFQNNLVVLPTKQKRGSKPAHVTMTDLGQRAGDVLSHVEQGEAALVTKRGRYVAAIVPLDAEQMRALFLRDLSADVGDSDDLLLVEQEPRNATISEVAAELGLNDPSADDDPRETLRA